MNFRASVKLAVLSGILASTAVVAAPKSIAVYNKSQSNSTIKVTSGDMAGTCVGDRLWTTPGETKNVPWNSINMLCYGKFPCTAEVYIGKKHDCGKTKGSDDKVAGTVTLESNGSIKAVAAAGHDLLGGMAQLTVTK